MAVTIDEAREILGDDLIGPADVRGALGNEIDLPGDIPFSAAELAAAKEVGDLLIARTASAGGTRLTIEALTECFPKCFDSKLLRAAGYALKNEWGILLEPLAGVDVCSSGWALVTADVLPPTRNLSFDEQQHALQHHLEQRALTNSGARRRTAVEAVYDTVVCFAVRQRKLLERTWDWTSSTTEDGGLIQVGGFGPRGMQVLSYSRGTRHGALGACLTRQPGS